MDPEISAGPEYAPLNESSPVVNAGRSGAAGPITYTGMRLRVLFVFVCVVCVYVCVHACVHAILCGQLKVRDIFNDEKYVDTNCVIAHPFAAWSSACILVAS